MGKILRMNIRTINEFIFAKHSITPGTQINSIIEIARNHVGLHSARIMTPYTTLCSRLTDYSTCMLRNQLYEEKTLIKMRCMRTTLHIVPIELASVFHMATFDIRLNECLRFINKYKIGPNQLEKLEDILTEFVNIPRSASEIENVLLDNMLLSQNKKFRIEAAKIILKYFWEKGTLCYVNTAKNWECENRKYALTRIYYPKIIFNQFSKDEAQELLIIDYINKYGPVTEKDISWWSGLGANIIRNILANNKKLIDNIIIGNSNKVFYISRTDNEILQEYKSIDNEWFALLAYEDPSLKGYYESRFRYVNDNHYNDLFNQIGEVRASIIHNGEAIGVWFWNKKTKKIEIEYFQSAKSHIKNKVKNLKERYEDILFPGQQFCLIE